MSAATLFENAAKDLNLAETWIASAVGHVKALFAQEKQIGGEAGIALLQLAADAEAFLAAATPAVAGEGLDFPADSVAYAAFVKLVADWQIIAKVLKDASAGLKVEPANAAPVN